MLRAMYNLWMKKPPRVALKKRPQFGPTFIRAWRNFRELNQETVAERVAETLGRKFTHASISRIENGKQPYTQPVLEAIAGALRCEPADLLMRNPLDKEAPWSIFDTLKRADQATRTRITAVVEALAKTGT